MASVEGPFVSTSLTYPTLTSIWAAQGVDAHQSVSLKEVEGFFKAYPLQCANRRALEGHLRRVGYSVNRFLHYLRESGRLDSLRRPEIYQPLLDAYLQWMRHYQHASEGTLELRSHSITQFLQWLGPEATPEGLLRLTAERIEKFFLSYAQSMGRSARHSMQSALRSFLRFCLHQGYIKRPLDLAVPTLRTYKLATVPRGLSDTQAQQVLRCIHRNSHAGRRDYAIVQLLYTYGVRGGQLRALRLEDIDWVKNQILFKASKHGKDSRLPLTAEVGESLLDYLQHARPSFFLPSRLPDLPGALSPFGSFQLAFGHRGTSSPGCGHRDSPARGPMSFGIALPPECSIRVIHSRPLPTCSAIAISGPPSSTPRSTSTP